jgi:AraC-like DNA-binding protein
MNFPDPTAEAISGPYLHSTDDVVAPSRFSYWREAICDSFVPLQPEYDADRGPFRGTIEGLQLGEFHGSVVTADAHHVQMSRQSMSRQGRSPFFANLIVRGQAAVSQRGLQGVARAGDIYIVDCTAPWEVTFPERFSMFCIEINDVVLRPRLGRRGVLGLPVVDGCTGPGRILSRYMDLLRGLPAQDLHAMQSLVMNHCTELLARAQVASSTASPAERGRRDLLERVHGFIERHLGDPALGAEAACSALRVSRSYLFKALAEAGLTFGACVRERRLQAARRALTAAPGRPVAEVAAEVGYADASAFSRAYRRKFGCSPRDEGRTGR